MIPSSLRASALAAFVAFPLILSGCGGSGGGPEETGTSPGSDSERASVAVFVTDAPSATDDFEAVKVGIERVDLVPDDAGPVATVWDGPTLVLDFLDLAHEAVPLGYHEGIRADARYCRIELAVDDIVLVLDRGDEVEEVELEVPGDGTLTLLPDRCITIEPGGVVHLQIDFDISRSIEEEDGDYRLRPVLHVDVIGEGMPSRLVRLEGEIAEIESSRDRVLLCEVWSIRRHDRVGAHPGCVWVRVAGDTTGLFDNVVAGGAPLPLDELFGEDRLGQRATVVGRIEAFGHPYLDLDVPAGQLPPPGECKLWHPGRPAGAQPPPDDCRDLLDDAPEDTVVIDHDGVIVLDRRGLASVDAIAVEIGDFLQVDGTVVDPVMADRFTMDVPPGEPIESADPLAVELQDAPVGGNGTRIVSREGELLAAGDVDAGESVSVDGMLVTTSMEGTRIRSALVIVDQSSTLERLAGTVMSVGSDSAIVATASAADNPCASVTADVMVDIHPEASFLTVTVTDTGSTTAAGGELESGQTVNLYGVCTPGGTFEAQQVVIIDDRRTP